MCSSDLEVDMPVSGSDGIIGRISHVSESLSRVLLISNINSRIPVIISEDGYHGMLIGQGRENPTIVFVEHIEKISIGDLVTTSGKRWNFSSISIDWPSSWKKIK